MTEIDTLSRQVERFRSDESGATAIEYAMIASGIGAFLAATVYLLGTQVKALFVSLANLFN
jgi:pilus assembly protein Flp/PilA